MANELLLYFKFNEYLTDQIPLVVDSSGRKIDGIISGDSTRVRESAIDNSGLSITLESPTPVSVPVAYTPSDFSQYIDASYASAASYDTENTFNLYRKFPDWIREEEQNLGEGNLQKVISLVSTYFDEIYNKTSQISKYKHQKIFASGDKEKIYPFYNKILTSTGFDVSDLFTNLSTTEKNASRDATAIWQDVDGDDISTEKIKNAIYQNIYSNLSYILKSKGTEKSIKTLLRSYGVDENLIKINVYGDGSLYSVGDKSTERAIRKKVVTLTDTAAITGSVGVSNTEPLSVFARVYFNEEIPEGYKHTVLSHSAGVIKVGKEDEQTYFYLNNTKIDQPIKTLSSDIPWLVGVSTTGSQLEFNAFNYATSTAYSNVATSSVITPSAITNVIFGGNTTGGQELKFVDVGAWKLVVDNETYSNWAKDITNYGVKQYKVNYNKSLFYCDLEDARDTTTTFINKLGDKVVTVSGHDVRKETLRTYKALGFETLNGAETIQILDEDDTEERGKLKKPSSLQLMVENSMYQIVSEEMINIFADISEYVEQLTYTGARYDSSYKNLDFLRQKFFTNVQNKLDIEKYIEFYKWIDSGLDLLIRQLIPASANSSTGLRNTVESHLLERNKYENRLPIWPLTNNVYTNEQKLEVFGDNSLKGEKQEYSEAKLSGNTVFNDIPNTQNIENINYSDKKQYFISVGKQTGLGSGGDEQVIASNFSSVDGDADVYRYNENSEYSEYNALLNKNKDKPLNTQPTGTLYDLPPPASSTACAYIPEGKLLTRRENNYIYSNDKTGSNLKYIAEPVIEFSIPSRQTIQISGARYPMDIFAPTDSEIDLFTPQFYDSYKEYKEQNEFSFAIDKSSGLDFLFKGPGSFYPVKSISNLASRGGFEHGERGDKDPQAGEKYDAKSRNRSLSVLAAIRRLTKEEAEDLEEDVGAEIADLIRKKNAASPIARKNIEAQIAKLKAQRSKMAEETKTFNESACMTDTSSGGADQIAQSKVGEIYKKPSKSRDAMNATAINKRVPAVESAILDVMAKTFEKRKMFEDASNISIISPAQRQDWLNVSTGNMEVVDYFNKYKV